jgi:hypothetical protein
MLSPEGGADSPKPRPRPTARASQPLVGGWIALSGSIVLESWKT